MSGDTRLGLLPMWGVLLCALLVPVLLAVGFITVLSAANPPGRELAQGEGYVVAATNNGIVILHGLAQLAFMVLGAIFLPKTTGGRVAFLVITIPFCSFVFLVTFIGAIAK